MNKENYFFEFIRYVFWFLVGLIEVMLFIVLYVDQYRYLGTYYLFKRAFIPNPFKMGVGNFLLISVFVIAAYCILSYMVKIRFNDKIQRIWDMGSLGLAVLLLLFVVMVVNTRYQNQKRIVCLQQELAQEKTVIHACGSIIGASGEEYTYTNSSEALNNCLANNNHFIEIDFDFTSDGKLVCCHYLGEDISEKDFMSEKEQDVFTHMNLDSLANVMKNNSDMYVVTDIKNNYNIEGCRIIAEKYPELRDNFIIQLYHDDEYEAVKKYGFNYMVLTLYGTIAEEREIPAIRNAYKKHDYLGITFWELWTVKNPDDFEGIGIDESEREYANSFYRGIQEIGMPIFVHTVNDQESILKDFFNGVSAVYTDNTNNDWIRY